MQISGEYYDSPTAGLKLYRRFFTPDPGTEIVGGAVFCHGWGDHLGCHEYGAQVFCEHGLLCTGVDWPGNGESEGVRGDLESVAVATRLIGDSVECLRGRLPEGAPIGLYAHSTGGLFSLNYMEQHPDEIRFAWLSSPLLRPEENQLWIKRAIAPLVAGLFPKLQFDTKVRARHCRRPEVPGQKPREFSSNVHHLVSARAGVSFMEHAPLIRRDVSRLRDPLDFMISQGSADPVCPPKYSRALFDRIELSRKRYVLLEGFLHEPLTDPEHAALEAEVRKWLDDVLESLSIPNPTATVKP